MSANFNFFVNRQGVQGQRGAKGDQGYSPIISVDTNNANVYKLKIQNEDTSFITPNLRGQALENTGGTYVRYDQSTESMYTGYADSATTSQVGVARFCTYSELASGSVENAMTGAMDVHDFVEARLENYVLLSDYNDRVTYVDAKLDRLQDYKVETSDFDTFAGNVESSLSSLSTNKLDKSTYNSYVAETAETLNGLATNKLDIEDLSDYLVQGSNITLSVDSETHEITISANVPTFTQVQADWNQNDNTAVDFIKNKPTIPTVNNSTITVTQGGVNKGSFTLNQGSDYTLALDAGATTIDWSDITGKPSFATVATSGSYEDLLNKPTIPTVNNATLTITQGGVSKGTFTANSSSDTTIDLDAPQILSDGNGIDINSSNEIDIIQSGETVRVEDFTMTGSVAIDSSDRAYNFSAGNTIKGTMPAHESISSMVVQVKVYCPYTMSGRSLIKLSSVSRLGSGPTGGIFFYYGQTSSVYTYNASIPSAADFYIRAEYDSSTGYTLKTSTDGTTWTTQSTNSDTTPPVLDDDIYITSNDSAYYNDARVYLTDTFVTVNDNTWTPYKYVEDTSDVAKATSSLYGLVKPDNSTIAINDGVISVNQAELTTKQDVSNLVTSVNSQSTDSQYPSAKLFYDTVGDIETILNDINSGNGGQS